MSSGISRRAWLATAGAGLAGAALTVGPLAALARAKSPARSAAKTPKALVIGLDGAMLGKIRQAQAPTLKALMTAGQTSQTSLPYSPEYATLSGVGWSSIATGVWPEKHKASDNTFAGNKFKKYPDFTTRIEQVRAELRTYAISSWPQLTSTTGGGPLFAAPDTAVATPGEEYDEGTTKRAAAYLEDTGPDATFIQLDNIDHAGHVAGTGQEYLDAIATADDQVGRILDAVKSRPSYGDEDWLTVITTDHGHRPEGGHGGASEGEKEHFVIAAGGGIPAGSTGSATMVDIAPTVFQHLGIAIDGSWGLDGKPLV